MTAVRQTAPAFPDRTTSVFADFQDKVYTHKYAVQLLVGNLHGGIPTDPNVTAGWIKTVLADKSDSVIQEMIAETIRQRGWADRDLTAKERDEVVEETARMKNLNGFKRFPDTGELYIEGRQVKSMMREAANIGVAGGLLDSGRKWGKTQKGLRGFLAEHVFVLEDQIGLGVTAPTGVEQRFVSTYRGTGIQIEEYVTDAKVSFTLATDYIWPKAFWPTVFVIAEQNGLGASRSMGFGKFQTVGFSELG